MPDTDTSLQRTREQLARREVGHTTVGRRTAWTLAAQFLLVVVGVATSEVLHDLRNPEAADALRGRLSRLIRTLPPASGERPLETAPPSLSRIVSSNRALIAELKRFEEEAEDVSPLGRRLRPPTQYLLTALGAGNEQVYPGRPPWLFYRQDVDYLTGPGFLEPGRLESRAAEDRRVQPDPRLAIRDLKEQLDARGIRLIVIPTPVKPTIHPERLASRLEGLRHPLRPASYPELVRALSRDGVLVFDPAPVLLEAKRRTGEPQHLATDTHWRPEAMELVAARLRDFIARHADLPPAPRAGYVEERVEVANLGDIARMLDLSEQQTRYPSERVRVRQVRTADHELWRPSRSADVLLLGDSFSNIYSLGAMGWGESAGLVERLSFLMQRPVDRIVQNADGAFRTRALLGRELGSGRDRLAGKRVVIFQFAERELAFGDWKLVDLALGREAPRRFFVPRPGEEVVVSGTIREIAPIPRPGTVPYRDHITALHLVDIASEHAEARGREAVVYVWGMRDNVLQEAAELRAGHAVSLRLRPWADVADSYDGISRTELTNDDVRFEEPTWGEVIP